MFIKVCGLTTEQQIDWACDLGYDAIGVVVTPRSKRCCSPERARALAEHARRKGILSFAVAYEVDEVDDSASAFDVIQLYEWAPLANLAYASATRPQADQHAAYFFYDASVGSGVYAEIPDWVRTLPGRVVIAGGLSVGNVESVINRYQPYGLDVSSSLELAPGIKSEALMAEFKAEVVRATNAGRA